MPRPRNPLPAQLGAVFSYAEARAAGVSTLWLQGNDLDRLTRGVYVRRPAASVDSTVEDAQRRRSRYLASVLAVGVHLPSGHFLSHTSAAVVWGLPVPLACMAGVDVACFAPRRSLRRPGVRGHQTRIVLASTSTRQGVRVTDPASTWAMLAPTLALRDAVALGDAALHQHRIPGTSRVPAGPLASFADLEASVAAGRRVGVARLRELLPLLSTESASAPESHLRLLLQSWGLPPPKLDFDVRGLDGALLGCSELAYPEDRLALEYEGGQHRVDTAQWNRDIEKYRHYAQAGWEVLRVTADLLYRRPEELRRHVEEALTRRSRC